MPLFIVPIIALFIVFIVIGAIRSAQLAKARTEGMQALSQKLGLQFAGEKDHSFDERYPFIEKLCSGKNRYGFNVLQGLYQGQQVYVFDYHYETTSRDSKGKRKTSHHYFSFMILHHHGNFPELIICREGYFSKMAQFFGFDDIDFESSEFSRQFLVKSPKKKFAYDVCHSGMIEYLLANQDLNIQIENDVLTLFFPRRLDFDQIEYDLQRLLKVRALFPDYLLQN
ncbi:hypothetical protein N9Y42_05400 [Mariniblastus sp.]|nr:hypothetical protein [Mariniblastus sp.]